MSTAGVADGSFSPVDRSALDAAVGVVLSRLGGDEARCGVVEFWWHDESPRRRHRRRESAPRWLGWPVARLVGVEGASHSATGTPTDLVLTTERLWLRSPAVYSAFGRRIAQQLEAGDVDELFVSGWIDCVQLVDTLRCVSKPPHQG